MHIFGQIGMGEGVNIIIILLFLINRSYSTYYNIFTTIISEASHTFQVLIYDD